MASRKKSVAERALGLAAPVMPAPVAQVMRTRWGSRLCLLLLPILFATGVLTISWNNGIPTVNFDRAKALILGQQVGKQVEQEAVRVAQDWRDQQPPAATQQAWGQPQPATWQGQPTSQQPIPNRSTFPPQQQPAPSWGPSSVR
jgi:hypothetical protein